MNYLIFALLAFVVVKLVNRANKSFGYRKSEPDGAIRVFGEIPYFSLHPGSGDSMDQSCRDMYGSKDIDKF